MPKPIYLEKDIINQLYHIDNLKLQEVADRLKVCKDTVRRNMRRYGIAPKAPIVYRGGQSNRIIVLLPLAKKLYFEELHSFSEVCEELRVSFYTLKRLFTDNGIQLRSTGESVRLAYSKHPSMGFKSGNLHPRYNGYRTYEIRAGYVRVYIPGHHRAGVNGYVFEHILVWEEAHKMPLPEGWTVHHLNGIKDDNRPENLVGMSSHAHRYILAEKAKRIRVLENRVKDLGKSLLEATKMNFH